MNTHPQRIPELLVRWSPRRPLWALARVAVRTLSSATNPIEAFMAPSLQDNLVRGSPVATTGSDRYRNRRASASNKGTRWYLTWNPCRVRRESPTRG